MSDKYLLDFCRVKKFNEKGFGFLKGIHYEKDIFFHLSNIKNDIFKSKFDNLVRGSFFLFFISNEFEGKRKVIKFWYDLKEVPKEYLDNFIKKIIELLNDGKTNIYDLIFIINELKENNYLSDEEFSRILISERIKNNPIAIINILTDEQIDFFSKTLEIDNLKLLSIEKQPYWLEEFLQILEQKNKD